MSNHTPAPWRVDRGSMLNHVNVITPHHEWICYLGSVSRPDVVADANLIAAAPELLEALEDFISSARTLCLDHSLGKEMQNARAAIAKAKGEI